MSTISDILAAFGLTGEIAKAVSIAELTPSSANVQAVFAAYARNGQTPPGPLVVHLYEINAERFPNDTITGPASSWLVYAAIGLLILWRLKRGRK
jgi:hypothetical protein